MNGDQQDGALGLDPSLAILRDGESLVLDPARRLRILMLKLYGYANAASIHLGNLELEFSGGAIDQLRDGMSLSGEGFNVLLLPGESVKTTLLPTDPEKPPYVTIQTAVEVTAEE